MKLHGVQKEIFDLSLKLDGRPFAGENVIFTIQCNLFPDFFIVFCNNCVALKKEKHRKKINSEIGLKIMTPRDIQ